MANAPRLLVVDDVAPMRRIVVGLLKEAGFRDVAEAEDGQAALQKLREGLFDLVISDVYMPRMSGLQMLEEIKADSLLSRVPVLMLTADSRKEDILRAAQLGAAGYVVKPFTKALLESKVLMILKRQAQPGAPAGTG